jgi:hypothetical protein
VPADVLIREALREIPREVLIEESLFCIERRWIDNALPDTEILDATSHALTVLCTLVDEAHNLISKVDRDITCDLRPRLVELRNTFPIDLVRADDDRKVWVGAQRLNPIKYTLETRDFAKVDIEKVRERYASDPDFEKRDNLELLEEGVRFFLYAAKQILMKDGRALSFVFALRRDDKQLEVLGLAMEDRVGKHIAMRQAAVVLSRIPVFWALLVGESWVSYLKPGEKPTRHAADDPSRQEALTVNGVSSDGAFRNAHVKFSRRNSGIVFGEERFDSDPTNLMTPVLAAIRQPAN